MSKPDIFIKHKIFPSFSDNYVSSKITVVTDEAAKSTRKKVLE